MMVLQVGLIFASITDTLAANKFNKGDFVEIYNTGIGLQVLETAGGKKIGAKSDGVIGIILSNEPTYAVGYNRWYIQWEGDNLKGWSAEGTATNQWLRKIDKILVADINNRKIYWLQNDKLYHVTGPSVLTKMKSLPGWNEQHTYSSLNYPSVPDFISTDSASNNLLVRSTNGDKVYLIENGKKRHIRNITVFNKMGYKTEDIIEVTNDIISMFQDGQTIPPETYSIKGYVKDNSNNGITGVTITLSGASSQNYTTGANGYYEFLSLSSSNYTITPNNANYSFTPQNKSYSPLNSNQDNQFTGTYNQPPSSILTSISSSPVNFGNVTVNQSTDKTITITNQSNSTGNLSGNVSISGESFTIISGDGSFNLSPEQSKQVTVRCSPTAGKSYSGQLSITHNATNQTSPTNISLSGVGVNLPPPSHIVSTPNTPSGPSSGKVGQSLSYSTGGSSCSQRHSVYYRFYWGDENYSDWSSSSSASYSWSNSGNYSIKTQAKCSEGITSAWFSSKSVSITDCTLSVNVSPSNSGNVAKDPNK